MRQIDYLSPHFDLTVIGPRPPVSGWQNVTFHSLPGPTLALKLSHAVFYVLGRLAVSWYERWFWRTRRFQEAFRLALASGADAIHANNWHALPIAIEVARRTGARVVFHQHEFAELEHEHQAMFRWILSPGIRHMLAKYTSDTHVRLDASITVCEPIAERYRRELRIDPIVVYNAPKPVELADQTASTDPGRIRLIYHGASQKSRGIETLVRTMGLLDDRFSLDLMLMDDDPGYIRYLRRLAEEIAPGRIFFREPVPPLEIVPTVSAYDVGLSVIQPVNYNTLMMLPNKLFEYLQAGLAVCIGPSPAMVRIVDQFGCGVRTTGFTADDVAAALNRLTADDINRMRRAARRAAASLNADIEMGKIVALYQRLLASDTAAVMAPDTAGNPRIPA
jgi:glycosyltransferase involved in cell wall biosynthesis